MELVWYFLTRDGIGGGSAGRVFCRERDEGMAAFGGCEVGAIKARCVWMVKTGARVVFLGAFGS